MLTSFGSKLNVVVVGATGGIGAALVDALDQDPSVERIFAFSRSGQSQTSHKIVRGVIDYDKEETILTAAQRVATWGFCHLVVVATGYLHDGDGVGPEKSFRSLTNDGLLDNFQINTIGPALVARHFMPLLVRDSKAVFAALSARVGSISDNQLGGWYGYRSSKAALNMIIKTLAIELGRNRPQTICVGLHPGTVDTALSKPFQSGVEADRLFTPGQSVDKLLAVVDQLAPQHTGHTFAWDGTPIPY